MTGISQLPRSSRDPMSRFRRPLNANALGDLVETMKSDDRQILDLRPYPFIDVPAPVVLALLMWFGCTTKQLND